MVSAIEYSVLFIPCWLVEQSALGMALAYSKLVMIARL